MTSNCLRIYERAFVCVNFINEMKLYKYLNLNLESKIKITH